MQSRAEKEGKKIQGSNFFSFGNVTNACLTTKPA
jgi:hypothetical protein